MIPRKCNHDTSQYDDSINYEAFFDFVCTPTTSPTLMETLTAIRFEGCQSDEIDTALSELIHPLDWFALESDVQDQHSGLISLTSDTKIQRDAIATADQLKLDFAMKPRVQPFQAAVYLSSDI